MKLLLSVFFVIVFTGLNDLTFAQKLPERHQAAASSFYPLAIGDYWEYFDYEWMGQLADTINALITSDTIIDGKKYTVVRRGSFHYHYHSDAFERFDSLGNLVRYERGHDSLLYRFADTSRSAWYSDQHGWTARWDKSGRQTIYGATRNTLTARYFNLSDTTSIFGGSSVTLVEGIGMTSQNYPEGVSYGLRGARVGGTQYGTITAIAPSTATPDEFQLLQNYPNPFNPSTNITFRVSRSAWFTVTVYNLIGQQIAVLLDERRHPGQYTLSWQATSFPSGVYFCHLQSGIYQQTITMLLLR